MIYIYSDESIFSEPNNYIGNGMIITKCSNLDQIINEALDNLRDDEDRYIPPQKKQDDLTLNRGYFHAADDSKNAHSHLCAAFNKIFYGEFVCDFFDANIMPEGENNKDYLFRLSSMMNSLQALQTREELCFYFEERQDLSIDKLIRLYSELEEISLMGIYDHPFIPVFFPKISLNIVSKANPGVQCADFLLWCVNRKKNNDETWFKRINVSSNFSFSAQHSSQGGLHLTFKHSTVDTENHYLLKDFPPNSDEQIDDNKIVNFYIWAVKYVDYYATNTPDHLGHLKADLEEISGLKINLQYRDYIANLVTLYLKLFDTAPIITPDTSNEDKVNLLLAKKYLSLVLRKDLVNGTMARIQLNKIRQHIIKNSPELLEE